MAWETPKTDWAGADAVTENDLNRVEGNAQELENNKVDKVTGKGLSANDYTTTEKNKLAEIDSTKAPTSHASTGTTYGVGTTANYGHVKVRNDLIGTETSGSALSPAMGKELKRLLDLVSPSVIEYSGTLTGTSGQGTNVLICTFDISKYKKIAVFSVFAAICDIVSNTEIVRVHSNSSDNNTIIDFLTLSSTAQDIIDPSIPSYLRIQATISGTTVSLYGFISSYSVDRNYSIFLY